MNILRSLVVALAMYSKLPLPRVEWDKKSMAHALAFFPLVGVLAGALLLGWRQLACELNFGSFMFAAGAMLCPLLLTGGIHLDGFCDVTDALSSWQPRERRLEILKDSHIGAFALIGTVCYMTSYLACWTELHPSLDVCLFIAAGYVLCRVLSGLSIICLRCAKADGLAATFAAGADKRAVGAVLLLWLVCLAAFLLWLSPFGAVCGLIVAAVCFFVYWRLAYGKFGGVNGDLAGWFLQVTELAWLALALLLQKSAIL